MIKLIIAILGCALIEVSHAQKFGYIDSDVILGKTPEYVRAQAEIDRLSLTWQQEIEAMQVDISALYNTLEAEKVMLTNRMQREREEKIRIREEELKAYQRKIFGYEGLLFLKKQELIRPLQDKVFEAVKKVAKKHNLAVIFDRASELTMVYTDPKHNYTDFVLEELDLGDPNDQVN